MHIAQPTLRNRGNIRQSQIVRTDEPDGPALYQGGYNPFGPNQAIARVCALQQLVKKEKNWRPLLSENADIAKSGDLGIEAGAAFKERIIDQNAGAHTQWSKLHTLRTYRRAGHSKNGIDAHRTHQSALPRHIRTAHKQ